MTPSPQVLRERAEAVAALLREAAVEARGGAVVWLGTPAADGRPTVLPPHLYDGTAGIALFLAALDRARGTDEHRETVLRAVGPLAARMRELEADPARAAAARMPLGGMVGLGSFIWALARIGQWTGDDGVAGAARAAARLVTPGRVAGDDQLDVVAGAAGTLLALLALDEAAPGGGDGADPPEAALWCAAHLLERRVGTPGTKAWPGADNPPLSGFAHGASGIAHALLRLYARTGRAELRDAALEGFAYERTLFRPAAGTWLDPRTGRPLEQSAWCHGAPGMALARLQASALRLDGAADELEGCLLLTRALPDVTLDHLCCGNAGRAEILLCAGRATGSAEMASEALAIAGRMLAAAGEDGHRYLPPGEPPAFVPSLFRGAAGVGYALLRLWRPDVFPSPLLLD